MASKYSVGDHVAWESEAGRVSGRIIRVHRKDFDYKEATGAGPRKAIRNMRSRVTKTDHVAAHKRSALTKID